MTLLHRALLSIWLCALSLATTAAHAQLRFELKPLPLGDLSVADIRNVTRDSAGFIYFGTFQGLWRFDGTSVLPMDNRQPLFPANFVPDVFLSKGQFFLAASRADTTLTIFDSQTGSTSRQKLRGFLDVHAINEKGKLALLCRPGHLYSLTETGTLKYEMNLSHLKNYPEHVSIQALLYDHQGGPLVFTKIQVGRISNSTIQWSGPNTWPAPGSLEDQLTFVRNVSYTSKYIVVDYSNALMVYDRKTLKRLTTYFGPGFEFSFIYNDLIFVVPVHGSVLPSSPYYTLLNLPLPALKIRQVFAINGHKWLIATGSGIYQMEVNEASAPLPKTWLQNVDSAFHGKSVRSIYLSGNKLYAGTYGGLFSFGGDSAKKLSALTFYNIFPKKGNDLLLASEGVDGFFGFNSKTNTVAREPQDEKRPNRSTINRYQNKFVGGDGGELYTITEDLQHKWHHRVWLQQPDLAIIKDIQIIEGNTWVASSNGLFRLYGEQLKKIYPTNGTLTVYAVLGHHHSILVGTMGKGLIQFDHKVNIEKTITATDGLAGDFVYSLTRVGQLIFVGTNKGICVLDKDLKPVAIPAAAIIAGKIDQEINHSATYFEPTRNLLIFGGMKGLTFVNTAAFKDRPAPSRVVLSYVRRGSNGVKPAVIDMFANLHQEVLIYPEDNFIGIKFAGETHKDILFRIKEISNNWQVKSLKDEIDLYALPAGRYTLEARYPDEAQTAQWLSKTLIVLPHFYQTWWFMSVLIILALGAVSIVWYFQLQKVKREHLLRTNIASDLHDELGSSLTRISISSDQMELDPANNRALATILAESKKAIASMSDVIWSIDSRNDTREDLVLRMRTHAMVMVPDEQQLNFTTKGLEELHNMSQSVRQNIYLIFKEALNNAVKHNAYPQISITMQYGQGMLIMEIKNSCATVKRAHPSGQGINNMKMRAARLKGSLEVTEDQEHFSVRLSVRL